MSMFVHQQHVSCFNFQQRSLLPQKALGFVQIDLYLNRRGQNILLKRINLENDNDNMRRFSLNNYTKQFCLRAYP